MAAGLALAALVVGTATMEAVFFETSIVSEGEDGMLTIVFLDGKDSEDRVVALLICARESGEALRRNLGSALRASDV